MLECIHRAGRARLLDWDGIRTPELIVPETHLGTPDWAAIRLTGKPAGNGKEIVSGGTWFYPTNTEGALVLAPAEPLPTDVVQVLDLQDAAVFHDAGGWAKDPKRMLKALPEAKAQAGARALWAPALGTPADYALWAYLGVDLFDASNLLLAATRQQVLTTDGVLSAKDAAALVGEADWSVERIAAENLENARRELALVRHHIQSGSLRALVERRVPVDPNAVAMLRRMDTEHTYLEAHAPLMGGPVPCMTSESLWMPEVERFRRRFRDDYVAPSADILVLLPCSARKPYRHSKTHRYFQRALDDSGVRHRVHEVMVTSPLGLVSRDLEDMFPAAHYDVPVTHHWTRDEEAIIRKQVLGLLDRHEYLHVIAHVSASTYTFLRDILPEGTLHTAHERPSGIEDCNRLRDTLRSVAKAHPAPTGRDVWRHRKLEDFRAAASMQFGEAAARALTEGANAHGRAPFIKVDRDGTRLAMTTDRGLVSLTLAGAKHIVDAGIKAVTMQDFKIKKTGSLFAVGVEDASSDIRPGDDVVVVRDGQLRGCGIALMPGDEMIHSTRGVAVNLRHIEAQ